MYVTIQLLFMFPYLLLMLGNLKPYGYVIVIPKGFLIFLFTCNSYIGKKFLGKTHKSDSGIPSIAISGTFEVSLGARKVKLCSIPRVGLENDR